MQYTKMLFGGETTINTVTSLCDDKTTECCFSCLSPPHSPHLVRIHGLLIEWFVHLPFCTPYTPSGDMSTVY